jgi:hypothetical protein
MKIIWTGCFIMLHLENSIMNFFFDSDTVGESPYGVIFLLFINAQGKQPDKLPITSRG